jgi:hypothetical protein
MTTAADSAATEQAPSRLTDAQLKELMRLIKGANSVELKLTVPVIAHRATIQGLPLDPVETQPRQVYFFDTPDLALYRAGVVVRARRTQGGKGDTVVKRRPVDPADIPDDLKNDRAFNIEVDALPGGFVCSASFKGRSTGQDIRDVVSGKIRRSKIFSKAQRAFFRLHAPMGLELDSLHALGPTFLLKGRFDAKTGLDSKAAPRSMVAEMWLYPDGSRILELSTKTVPNDAFTAASEMRAYLVNRDVPTNAAQETKTRIALEFYSKNLMAELAAEEATQKRTARATRRASAGASAAKPKATTAKAATVKAPAKAAPAKAARAKAAPAKAKATAAKPAAAKPAATTRAASTTRRAAAPRKTTGTTTQRAPARRTASE